MIYAGVRTLAPARDWPSLVTPAADRRVLILRWHPNLKQMGQIDRLHLELPFAGSRMLQGHLKQEGFEVGRLHVATLMKRMDIETLYRRPNRTLTSVNAPDQNGFWNETEPL